MLGSCGFLPIRLYHDSLVIQYVLRFCKYCGLIVFIILMFFSVWIRTIEKQKLNNKLVVIPSHQTGLRWSERANPVGFSAMFLWLKLQRPGLVELQWLGLLSIRGGSLSSSDWRICSSIPDPFSQRAIVSLGRTCAIWMQVHLPWLQTSVSSADWGPNVRNGDDKVVAMLKLI